mmetsp:Transcript_15065/g.19929  ORF Transcript_15065/g.19929 Transcript_15065/m.19929 type:complete len:89 (+) Transcript_15065:249-515(+)
MGYSLPVYTYNHPICQVVIELPLGMQPLRARAMMKNKKIDKEAASFAMLCNPRLMSLVYSWSNTCSVTSSMGKILEISSSKSNSSRWY